MVHDIELTHQNWHDWQGSRCDASCPYRTSPVKGVAETTEWAARAYTWRRRAVWYLVAWVAVTLLLGLHLLWDHSERRNVPTVLTAP